MNMNTNLTEIACVIDRSGSMSSIAADAIGGFNTFLDGQKRLPGQARLTLVLFNENYTAVCESADIQSIAPLDNTTYVPAGTTALLDAVGRTIDDLGARLAAVPEPERPAKVIFAILTDGMENASRKYSLQDISDRIRHQGETYSWEFVFLAANQDAIATASRISIRSDAATNFAPTSEGVRYACADMGRRVSAYRNADFDFTSMNDIFGAKDDGSKAKKRLKRQPPSGKKA
jgi:hypothetical protein